MKMEMAREAGEENDARTLIDDREAAKAAVTFAVEDDERTRAAAAAAAAGDATRAAAAAAVSISGRERDACSNGLLTVRLLMNGKEVGCLIGKKGETVRRLREEHVEMAAMMKTTHSRKSRVVLRFVLHTSQCGSLIGKAGTKIKEIREVTGASVQVASEMLTCSTDRIVTISGQEHSILPCINHILSILNEFPTKGNTIPYQPRPTTRLPIGSPCSASQITSASEQASTSTSTSTTVIPQSFILRNSSVLPVTEVTSSTVMPSPLTACCQQGHLVKQFPTFTGCQGMMGCERGREMFASGNTINPAYALYCTSELVVTNDLVGCIIGWKGSKINEIRKISGATIKITQQNGLKAARKVTVIGTPDSVHVACTLIGLCLAANQNATGPVSDEGSSVLGSYPAGPSGLGARPSGNDAALMIPIVQAPSIPFSTISQQIPVLNTIALYQMKNYASDHLANKCVFNGKLAKFNSKRFSPY